MWKFLFGDNSPVTDEFLEKWVEERKESGLRSGMDEILKREMAGFLSRWYNNKEIEKIILNYAGNPEFILGARKLLRR